MPVVDSSAFAFFSSGLARALDEHTATLSRVLPPSLLIRDEKQGKQSFPGSIVRLRDGSTLVVGLTGGTYTHSDGTFCLQLSPMTGGQAKRWLPGDLAQSVLWIALGCLSSQDFQTQTPPVKQGCAAAHGIFAHDDTNLAVRLVWAPGEGGHAIGSRLGHA